MYIIELCNSDANERRSRKQYMYHQYIMTQSLKYRMEGSAVSGWRWGGWVPEDVEAILCSYLSSGHASFTVYRLTTLSPPPPPPSHTLPTHPAHTSTSRPHHPPVLPLTTTWLHCERALNYGTHPWTFVVT